MLFGSHHKEPTAEASTATTADLDETCYRTLPFPDKRQQDKVTDETFRIMPTVQKQQQRSPATSDETFRIMSTTTNQKQQQRPLETGDETFRIMPTTTNQNQLQRPPATSDETFKLNNNRKQQTTDETFHIGKVQSTTDETYYISSSTAAKPTAAEVAVADCDDTFHINTVLPSAPMKREHTFTLNDDTFAVPRPPMPSHRGETDHNTTRQGLICFSSEFATQKIK